MNDTSSEEISNLEQNQQNIEQVDNALEQPLSEKMIKESVAQNAIKHERHRAYEKGRNEAIKKFQSALNSDKDNSINSELSPEEIRSTISKMVAEETQKKLQEISQYEIDRQNNEWARNSANEFVKKMEEGKSQYQDFDSVISPITAELSRNDSSLVSLIPFLNGVDNVADILYHLGQNLHKIPDLLVQVQQTPIIAKKQIEALSNSIKENKKAISEKPPKAPLRQIESSNVTIDNGYKTVDDYKKAPWLQT